ncbi:MAG: DUF4178 domain-containing protein [Gammaproteobacteria bacterium]|nr:DUF4178 domain-containing protein [Gammaproteobacteria bacterium]
MSSVSLRLEAIRGLNPLPVEKRKKLDVTSLKKGGYLELDDQTWKVNQLFFYLDVKWYDFSRRKKDYWVTELELFSLNTGKTIYLEWEIDDRLEISKTTALVKLRDIRVGNKAVSRADLDYIADEEEGKVEFNGVSYAYCEEDTWAGLFLKSKDSKAGVPMRSYEFESDDEQYLSIETWHKDDKDRPQREAFLSQPINKHSITVLQTE